MWLIGAKATGASATVELLAPTYQAVIKETLCTSFQGRSRINEERALNENLKSQRNNKARSGHIKGILRALHPSQEGP